LDRRQLGGLAAARTGHRRQRDHLDHPHRLPAGPGHRGDAAGQDGRLHRGGHADAVRRARADRLGLGLLRSHPGPAVPADRRAGPAGPHHHHAGVREDREGRAVLAGRRLDREHRRGRLGARGRRRLQPSAGAGRRADGADRLLRGHLPRARRRADHGRPVTVEELVGHDPLTVVAVRHHRHRAPLLRPFVTAARRTEAVEYVVAEVELSGGAVGQGSAAETVAVTGESAETISSALAGPLRAALEGATGTLGQLTARLAGALDGASSATAALEVALHDAWARSLDAPLVELLGGRLEDGLMNDMTISLEEPDVMAEHARAAVARGEQILKIKLGHDIAEDRRRLAAVVAAAQEDLLRHEANHSTRPETAIEIISGFTRDGLPIELVEQPVAARNIEGLARVAAAVELPIMADEAVWTAEDARRLVDAD